MRHEGGSPLLCFVEVVVPPHSPLPPLQWRGEKTAALEEGGEGGLVEKQWGCNRILRVWIVLGLVMAADWSNTTGLQSSVRMFEQRFTCIVHLHFHQSQWIFLDWKTPSGWHVKRACWTQRYNIMVRSYYNHNGLLCALTDYHWRSGKQPTSA